MNTKVIVLLAVVVLLVSVTGCVPGATRLRVGKLVTESESVSLGGATSVRAEINMGAGELSVTGGAGGLLEADFIYNVAELKPEVKYSGGTLTVQHPDTKSDFGSIWDLDDYRCEWDLRLNDDVAMDLSVKVGAGTTDLEIGSLSLTKLDVDAGAGEITVDVSGAVSLTRLDLDIGAGNVTLDLTGNWERDLDVELKVRVVDLRLGDAQSLPFTAGEALDGAVGLAHQANQLDHLVDPLVDLDLGALEEEAGRVFQSLARCHMLVEACVLGQVTDIGANIHAVAHDIAAKDGS